MEQMFHIEQEEDDRGGAFFIRASDKRIAELLWRNQGDHTIEVHRTFTDPSLRGKGVAGHLVERIADLATERQWHIQATCSYAHKVLEGNRAWRKLLS